MNLEDAIEDIMRRSPQDSTRLAPLADYAKVKLDEFGLPGVIGGPGGELSVRGLARSKDWDVAYYFEDKPRLLVSLKSIWRNASGTVPNRLDDLMGEAANIQQLRAEIVIGYILLFDAQADTIRKEDGRYWSQFFEAAVKAIAIRRPPLWNQGLLEGTWFIKFDSQRPHGNRILEPEKVAQEEREFFFSLLRELKRREPAIPFSKSIPDDNMRH